MKKPPYVVTVYRPRERAAPLARVRNFTNLDEARSFFRSQHIGAIAAELLKYLGPGEGYRRIDKRGAKLV